MAGPIFIDCFGTVDGVNLVFETPTEYFDGTLVPHLNGLAQLNWLDSEGPGKFFTVKEAPILDDAVQAFYIEK